MALKEIKIKRFVYKQESDNEISHENIVIEEDQQVSLPPILFLRKKFSETSRVCVYASEINPR